jgi:hypothetical protein
MWGALSDEKTGVPFAVQLLNDPIRAEPVTILYCLILDSLNLEGQVLVFMYSRNRVARLRFAGLRWRYSEPPLQGTTKQFYSKSQSSSDLPARQSARSVVDPISIRLSGSVKYWHP